MDREQTCCFTGHRPDKLPWGEDEADPRCLRLKRAVARAVEDAYVSGVRHFISGMARGVDLYCAEAVLELREAEPDILLECARPCETQADGWPAAEQERYRSILDRCDFETRRNRYMVDRSDMLIAVYNGVPKGGTFQTLAYAMKKGLAIHTIDLEDFL